MFHFYLSGALLRLYCKNVTFHCWLGFLSLAVFATLVYIRYEYVDLKTTQSYFLSVMAAYIGCFAFYVIFQNYMNSTGILNWIGQATLGIYAIHMFLLKFYEGHDAVSTFVLLILCSCLCLVVIRRTRVLRFLIGEYN